MENRSGGPRRAGLGAVLVAALAIGGCAPEEADAPVSELVRTAPPPRLAPTATFEAPRVEGVAASVRVAGERDALAARAAALRARGAALSVEPVLVEDERERLTSAADGEGEMDP
ncbi:hypothetical protein [Amaricoccus sp.]|uniref:hypothetical protein n=1 Tax=Amaricoccus sp. TaxID=1872485 RepID=UPI001B412910|nr:hypothetical protein [Amaricoccus sp.]MBP7241744.1 hypothetical protein [Amaricoccus sp.]